MLEALERARLCELVKVGCGREAAAKYVGLTLEQLEAEIARDDALAKDLLRAEGAAVLAHMGNVRKAATRRTGGRASGGSNNTRGTGSSPIHRRRSFKRRCWRR